MNCLSYQLGNQKSIRKEGHHFQSKLMLFKTANLMSAAAGRYGVSASSIFRKDLGALFLKLMGGILVYSEDTSNLLIKHHMWDHPPLLEKK
ncbi:hypothetical protein CR203_08800 [Salipaludibacillus neizhouensis]|uniref:Uncharacterized protein n=3 Tax=Salipaludibacillus neizhouensis TaxID=885475 RepID=A0A3A9KIA9_9BACI|nr:hypothetical protein CR203_08800 [Salipaludibacillus neizhouensis]